MVTSSLLQICAALNQAGVRYLVVGGLAVNLRGYVRFTNDLDLVIGFEPDNLRQGLEILSALGYRPKAPVRITDFADPTIRAGWIHHKCLIVFQLWSPNHERTPIDIFVSEPFPFDAEYVRASPIVASGVSVPVVSVATLIAMKRAAGRDTDLIDISKLLKLYPDADRPSAT
jgi:hypothetical protein